MKILVYRNPTDNDVNRKGIRCYFCNEGDFQFQNVGVLSCYEETINGGENYVDNNGGEWEHCKIGFYVDLPSGCIELTYFGRNMPNEIYYAEVSDDGKCNWIKSFINNQSCQEFMHFIKPPWMTYIQRIS